MIRTKRQANIAIRVVKKPGITAKQLSQDCHCTLATVYRMIKAGDLAVIRRRIYDPTHKFTVAEVQSFFPKRVYAPKPTDKLKAAADRYRAKIGAPSELQAKTMARLIQPTAREQSRMVEHALRPVSDEVKISGDPFATL